MSDIVERLREVAERADANYPAIMEQAADTITNLRAEVERLTADRAYTDDARVDALALAADTITTLRAEVERQVQWVKDLADNLIAEEAKTATLRAENERLTADRAYTDDARVDALDWAEQLRAENERLRAALTPSGDTKGAYHGEFYIEEEIIDEEGEPKILRIPVPWTTIKEIMAAIRARAALAEEKSG